MICEADAGSGNNTFNQWNGEKEPKIFANISEAEPLKLDDGYELAVRSIDIDGNKVYLELFKDGQVVYSKVIIAANEKNGTFVYSKPGTV